MKFLGLAAVQPLYGDTSCLQLGLNLPPYKAGYGPVDILQIYFSFHTSCLTCGTTVYFDVMHLIKCIGLLNCLQCGSPGAMQDLTIQTATGVL